MELLILLVQRRGQLITRSQIVDVLWGKDVCVDVENGIHTAVRKVRHALNDSCRPSRLSRDGPWKRLPLQCGRRSGDAAERRPLQDPGRRRPSTTWGNDPERKIPSLMVLTEEISRRSVRSTLSI